MPTEEEIREAVSKELEAKFQADFDAKVKDLDGGGAFNKVLGEKKNAMEKLRTQDEEIKKLKLEMSSIEEAKLKENEDFKGLAKIKEEEAMTWKEKYESTQKSLEKGVKKTAIKNELSKLGIDPVSLDRSVFLANLDNLKYDPDSRAVTGAEDEAKAISESFPRLFETNNTKTHDGAAGGSSMTELSVEDWKKMSREDQVKHKELLYKSSGISRTK